MVHIFTSLDSAETIKKLLCFKETVNLIQRLLSARICIILWSRMHFLALGSGFVRYACLISCLLTHHDPCT